MILFILYHVSVKFFLQKGVLNIENSSYYFDPMKSMNSATIDGYVHNVYRFQGVKQLCAVNGI